MNHVGISWHRQNFSPQSHRDTEESWEIPKSSSPVSPPHPRPARAPAPDSATSRTAPKAAFGGGFQRRSTLPWREAHRAGDYSVRRCRIADRSPHSESDRTDESRARPRRPPFPQRQFSVSRPTCFRLCSTRAWAKSGSGRRSASRCDDCVHSIRLYRLLKKSLRRPDTTSVAEATDHLCGTYGAAKKPRPFKTVLPPPFRQTD